jgi:glyoxylase-like metal-dependent hydrolase (beta-lactamase superfamily II)
VPPAPESEVAPGVRRLRLPTPFPIGPVCVYLIEDEPLTLIDAGPNSASTLQVLETELREHGHKISDIELILITHQHLDHMGLSGILAASSGADVAAIDLLQPWMANYDEEMAGHDRFVRDVMIGNGVPRELALAVEAMGRRTKGWGVPAAVTVPLKHGEQLRLRDRTLTALHRPGHSPSDTVFRDGASRHLFVGDHLLARVSSNPVITQPLSGSRETREQALVTYIESLKATALEDVDLILPGHGRRILDHRRLIAERMDEYTRRRDQLHALIAQRPSTAHELALELWGDEAYRQAHLTISEVLGHLDLLLNDGAIVSENDETGVVRFAATGVDASEVSLEIEEPIQPGESGSAQASGLRQ